MDGRADATWAAARAAEVRRHPFVAAALAATAGATLAARAGSGSGAKAAAYLAAMLAAALVTDVVAARSPPAPLPVRHPLRETIVVAGLTLLGALWLFVSKLRPDDWQTLPRAARLAADLVGVACLFQAAGAVYLLASRYRPADLGVRVRGLLVAPCVLAVVATTACLADPDSVTLSRAVAEMGWPGLLAFALFGEPLFEEVMRFLLQTRVGALLENRAAGWFLAALPWAALHVPMWYARGGDLAGAFAGAVCIVPIGLLWSYVALRTGSLLPALLVHGFNLWGLQNP